MNTEKVQIALMTAITGETGNAGLIIKIGFRG